MKTVRKSVWVACGATMACLLLGVWALHAGPLDPSAPPASTMKSLQEVYDLTNSIKGAALPAPLVGGGRYTVTFLQVDGIQGESDNPDHKDWIEPSAFHWGVSRPGQSFPTGGGAPAPVADHGDLTIVKEIDKATPKLFLKCCNGGVIATVKLEIWPPAFYKAPVPIVVYELRNVIVTSAKPVGAEGAYLMEEVSFNYRRIDMTYNEFNSDGGGLKSTTKATWDRQTNTGS
jgi:type VI secretion system secreted protein Hcp